MDDVYATIDDLQSRWRQLVDEPEVDVASTLLGDASQLIRDEGFDASKISPSTLRRVVCAVVKRAMAASALGIGVESIQQAAGPYQASAKFANPAGDIYLLKSERRALKGGARGKAFTIGMSPPQPRREDKKVPAHDSW